MPTLSPPNLVVEPIIPGHCSNVFITWDRPADDRSAVDIVGGGTYSGGQKVVPVIPGKGYHFTKGANETSMVNGTETHTVTAYFYAQGPTVTLNGTGAVTAIIKELLAQTYRVYRDRDIIYEMPAVEHQDQQPIADPDRTELTAYTYRVDSIDISGGIASSLAAVIMPECTPTAYPIQFGGRSTDRTYANTVDASGNVIVTGIMFGSFSHLLYVSKLNTSAVFQWTKTIEVIGAANRITDVTTDAAGNVFICGEFVGRINFGNGWVQGESVARVFVAKYNSSGVFQFSFIKTESAGRGGDRDARIALHGGNIFICGGRNGDKFDQPPLGGYNAFLQKYNSSGVLQWDKHYHISGTGDNYVATGMTIDSSGDLRLVGGLNGSLDMGCGIISAGITDLTLAKVSGTDGSCVWSQRHGSQSFGERGFHVMLDSHGDLIVAGRYIQYGNVGGSDLPFGNNHGAIFVGKYDADGDHVWSKAFPCPGACVLYGAALGDNDSLFICGDRTAGGVTFGGISYPGARGGIFAKYSTNGDELAFTPMGLRLQTVAAAPASKIVVVGETPAEGRGDDIFVEYLSQ